MISPTPLFSSSDGSQPTGAVAAGLPRLQPAVGDGTRNRADQGGQQQRAAEELTREHLQQRLRDLGVRESLWRDLEQFVRSAHASLRLTATANAIANDGRRLLGCDRLCVAVCRGRRVRIAAVSGADHVDVRSPSLVALARLVDRVLATRQPFWFDPDHAAPAPQIEEVLHPYLDLTHGSALAILPLPALPGEPAVETGNRAKPGDAPTSPVGAIVLEQLRASAFPPTAAARGDLLATHSATAIQHALRYDGLLWMPFWRAVSRGLAFTRQRLATAAALVALFAGLAAVLAHWPADMRVAAPGKLVPAERREVFAQVDGLVSDVLIEHAMAVTEGQELLRLRSTDLEVAISELEGQRAATAEQIDTKEQLLLRNSRIDPVVQDEIAGDLYELKQTLLGLDQRLELLREKSRQLTVRSPMAGQVVTWQVADTLLRRPVRRGQALLTIVNPDGPWELELYVPERRIGHVLRSMQQQTEPLTVQFQLTALPGEEFSGQVIEVQRIAEQHGEHGNSVCVRVAFEQSRKSQLAQLPNETSVAARIVCGSSNLGFVLFQDVVETLSTSWHYWF